MTITVESGLPTNEAIILILSAIERSPGIRPSELATYFVQSEDSPNNAMSRATFYRAISRLIKEKKIEFEKLDGSIAKRYFLAGKRPSIIQNSGPTELENFIIDESKQVVSEIIASNVLLLPPSGPTSSMYEGGWDDENQILSKLNARFSSTYNVIWAWELSRGIKIPRPWDNSVLDFNLGMGADFSEAPLTRGDLKHGNEQKELSNDELQKIKQRLIDALRDGKYRRLGRYPDVREWFTFFINTIDTVSLHIKKGAARTSNYKRK